MTNGEKENKMESYKITEIKAKDIKPGDTVKDGILGGPWYTIKGIRLTLSGVFMETATSLSIHAKPDEIFIKEITPAEEGEEAAKQDKIVEEQTAEFLETAASLEDTEEKIIDLQMIIQANAETLMNRTGKHRDDLVSLHECCINPEDLDQKAFYQDLEEEIGEALNKAKEMNEASQDLEIEIAEKERLEEILNIDK